MENLAWLALGLLLGAAIAWAILSAIRGKSAADRSVDIERARADVADARSEVAEARTAQARAEAALATAVAQRDAALQRATEISDDRARLVEQFTVVSSELVAKQSTQLDASAELRLKQTAQLLTPVQESLARFNDRITQVEKERVSMSTQLRDQVSAVQLTGESLRKETAALATALRRPQTRGAWGELQLRRVVELAGMVEHCDFVQQETTVNSSGATIRPDLKVLLTDDRYIYVDSKVPLTAFLDAQEAADEAERTRLLQQFARNVTSHVDQLSKKDYFKAEGGSTPEYVILFLAADALAAEAFSQSPRLIEYAAERGIMLATPSSLITTLKTAAFAWKQVAMADSAKEVFGLGRELYDRLSTLGKHFDKLGRSLTGAVGAYNDAVGSLEGRVFPTARKLRELKLTDKELAGPSVSESAVRPLTAAELVADAVSVPALIGRTSQAAAASSDLAETGRGEPGLAAVASEESVEAQLRSSHTA